MSQAEELILAALLNKPVEHIIAHPDLKLAPDQARKFLQMKRQLAQGLPLAYILGYRWFYGYRFLINKNVLIPRPETEQLVDLAAQLTRKYNHTIIADIGTGSGAIIIALKKTLSKSTAQFYAVDLSDKALMTAKLNAKNLKTRINFIQGNLASPLLKKLQGKNILITANLPYLSAKELREPSIKHEPKLALYGGKKAHLKIELLLKQLAQAKFKRADILLEINYNQAKTIKNLAKKYLPNARVTVYKDLNSLERVIVIAI